MGLPAPAITFEQPLDFSVSKLIIPRPMKEITRHFSLPVIVNASQNAPMFPFARRDRIAVNNVCEIRAGSDDVMR